MKLKEYFMIFKRGLVLIPSRLFGFIKKLFPNVWFYFMFSLIPLLIAFIAMSITEALTHNGAAAMVFKIISTIGQIIPLSMSLYLSESELIDTDEDSAEICFTLCAAVIAYIWLKF